MTDKIAPGSYHEAPVLDVHELAREDAYAANQKKRDQGVWYAVAGIGLIFAGSISTALSIGGMLMVVYGIAHYIRYSLKMARHSDDPWKDPELDAWEESHYGEGEEMEGESIVTPDPDAAWGGKLH